MNTPLPFIGAAERKAADTVRDFAMKVENHWSPPGGRVPGNDPRHVLFLGDLRCVFSITQIGEKRYRHMSASVRDRSDFPHPGITEAAGKLLGFEGSLQDWFAAPDVRQGCVVIIQELRLPESPLVRD